MGFVQDLCWFGGSWTLGSSTIGSSVADTSIWGSRVSELGCRIGLYFAGIMMCTIRIIVSGGILRANPRLAKASASVFSSLGT